MISSRCLLAISFSFVRLDETFLHLSVLSSFSTSTSAARFAPCAGFGLTFATRRVYSKFPGVLLWFCYHFGLSHWLLLFFCRLSLHLDSLPWTLWRGALTFRRCRRCASNPEPLASSSLLSGSPVASSAVMSLSLSDTTFGFTVSSYFPFPSWRGLQVLPAQPRLFHGFCDPCSARLCCARQGHPLIPEDAPAGSMVARIFSSDAHSSLQWWCRWCRWKIFAHQLLTGRPCCGQAPRKIPTAWALATG